MTCLCLPQWHAKVNTPDELIINLSPLLSCLWEQEHSPSLLLSVWFCLCYLHRADLIALLELRKGYHLPADQNNADCLTFENPPISAL